ncbi:MAG: SpoIIE family protein phosphatase [Gammaproteobacteria bacterium]|nr:SpoIIE family protein phosphatase [Gammaproteobacteria bacterium]
MDRIRLESQGACSLERVSEVRRLLDTVSMAAGASASLRARLTTCFSEAATNIVQHASPPATSLLVQLGQNHREWWLALTSNGGHPGDTARRATDATATHGRGLMILDELADEFSVSRVGPNLVRTQLRFTRSDRDSLPRVLVVEDDPALRALYRHYLEDDFLVTSCADGSEALREMRRESFDVFLSDIHMPDMDGFTLRQKLLDDAETELVPFLFLTGENDTATLALAQQMLIDDCLLKPVDRPRLIAAIERAMLRKRQLLQRLGGRLVRSIGGVVPETRLDSSPAWHVASGSRGSGEGGGDLIIEHRIGDTRIVVVADVMGHDAQARFFSLSYSGFIHGLFAATREPLAPHVIMGALSDAISHHGLLQASMLTCCVLVLHPGGCIEFCTAGHPPLLHLTSSNVEPLSTGGALPGLFDGATYRSSSVMLQPGERLAAYTDGLFESAATVAGREQLEEQVLQAIRDAARLTVRDAVDRVMHTFDAFASPSSRDDTTLVIIEPRSSTQQANRRC